MVLHCVLDLACGLDVVHNCVSQSDKQKEKEMKLLVHGQYIRLEVTSHSDKSLAELCKSCL